MEGESLMDAILKGEKPTNFLKQPMTVAFDSFVSPIDGTILSNKHDVREHEKKHGVVQIGNDLAGVGNNGLTRQESTNKQKGKIND